MSINAVIRKITLLFSVLFFTPVSFADTTLRIGASPGPYADFLYAAAKLAKEQGLDVKVIEFTEPTQINDATQSGDIDLNNFQHIPYMEAQNKARGYRIVAIKPSFVAPEGVYSTKYTSLKDVPNGAKVGIPNDPANEARALYLLQTAGLIKIKANVTTNATIGDVEDNPKQFKFIPLTEVQVPRSLQDLDIGLTGVNKAVLAGLDPKNALLLEGKDSLWTIVWATRADKVDDPRIKKFIRIFESDPIKQLIIERFHGAIIPAW